MNWSIYAGRLALFEALRLLFLLSFEVLSKSGSCLLLKLFPEMKFTEVYISGIVAVIFWYFSSGGFALSLLLRF